ncbi:hypothetical protein EVAR_89123_1 [Eumeta japonica]|uniref:Uncharacterized protein n=1 Tax=Eumeta variegata TaxID=151549 RepID=A0A4C1ZS28_EUMVA|nr:hypothetical protein EVAR_89123_1 [Eumeta japonica]
MPLIEPRSGRSRPPLTNATPPTKSPPLPRGTLMGMNTPILWHIPPLPLYSKSRGLCHKPDPWPIEDRGSLNTDFTDIGADGLACSSRRRTFCLC